LAELAFTNFIEDFRKEFNTSPFAKTQEYLKNKMILADASDNNNNNSNNNNYNPSQHNDNSRIDTYNFYMDNRGRGGNRGTRRGSRGRGGSRGGRPNFEDNNNNNNNSNNNRGRRGIKRTTTSSPNRHDKKRKINENKDNLYCKYCNLENSHSENDCIFRKHKPCLICNGDHTLDGCDRRWCYNCKSPDHIKPACTANVKGGWPREYRNKMKYKPKL
jgi:hypothetical protein